MKNFFISILLSTSFSASLFAAGEYKAVLTDETRLELAVLCGVFNLAVAAAWDAAENESGIAARDAIWEAARAANGHAAVDEARTAARTAVLKITKMAPIASYIVVIGNLPDIQNQVHSKSREKLKILTPEESVRLYSVVRDILTKSFNDQRYDQILEPIKTFYAVSLARIFPIVDFENRPEFKAYVINIHAHSAAVHDCIKILAQPLRCLVVGYIYADDPLDQKVLPAYVLDKLGELNTKG